MNAYENFRLFCEQASDSQLVAIYQKERDAGRDADAAIAKAVALGRGLAEQLEE